MTYNYMVRMIAEGDPGLMVLVNNLPAKNMAEAKSFATRMMARPTQWRVIECRRLAKKVGMK